MPSPRFPLTQTIDLEEIAQRIIALAEIATTEHLDALLNSQAEEMFKLARELDIS